MRPGTSMTMLADLQWHWGEAYLIMAAGGHWLAQRRDDGRLLTAASPGGLRELITDDYEAQPVPREVAP